MVCDKIVLISQKEFYMKNYAKVLVFAAIVALVVVPAHADTPMCELIKSMQGVF